MLGKKIIFLCKMSVFEGNAEVINKLSQKGNKDINHSGRESTKALKKDLTIKDDSN